MGVEIQRPGQSLHLLLPTPAPFDAKNPFLAVVTTNRKLNQGTERHLMHLELDISDSKIRYQRRHALPKLSSRPPVPTQSCPPPSPEPRSPPGMSLWTMWLFYPANGLCPQEPALGSWVHDLDVIMSLNTLDGESWVPGLSPLTWAWRALVEWVPGKAQRLSFCLDLKPGILKPSSKT